MSAVTSYLGPGVSGGPFLQWNGEATPSRPAVAWAMKELPVGAKQYLSSPKEGVYVKDSIPAGLRRAHTTKSGTWGRIRVDKGELTYRILEPEVEEHVLTPGAPGVIEPRVPHEVSPLTNDVEFAVEFYRLEGAEKGAGGAGGGGKEKTRYKRIPRVRGGEVKEVPVADIIRPLGKLRKNDQTKVAWLMESISEIGLQVPIDVLEVDGKLYGFSGCHRYEAHVKLGLEMIRCRVRMVSQSTLEMHMR